MTWLRKLYWLDFDFSHQLHVCKFTIHASRVVNSEAGKELLMLEELDAIHIILILKGSVNWQWQWSIIMVIKGSAKVSPDFGFILALIRIDCCWPFDHSTDKSDNSSADLLLRIGGLSWIISIRLAKFWFIEFNKSAL